VLTRLVMALRVAARRIVADRMVVAAGFATILLSTILLSTGPIYAEAITFGAFSRGMETAPPTDSGVSIRAGAFPEDIDVLDQIVDSGVTAAFRPTSAVVTAIFRVDGRSMQFGEEEPFRAAVWNVNRIDSLATVVEGRWPEPSETDSVAVPIVVAQALGIGVGDQMTISRSGSTVGEVEIVGTYSVQDPDDAAWFGDPLIADGTIRSGGNLIYGPFLVSHSAVLAAVDTPRVDVRWRVTPDYQSMRPGDVDLVRSGIVRLQDDLNARLGTANVVGREVTNFDVSTNLPSQLDTIGRSLTITSSTVLTVLLQLSLLAGYALVLTSRLMVDSRTGETALVRSRGGSPSQLAVTAGIEGLLLTVPAVAGGPPLAASLLRVLNQTGPLASIDMTINPRPNTAAYVLAAVAGVVALVALVLPAWRAARAFPDPERRARRQSSRSLAQRLGVDVALVALLVLAVWQLDELGPRVTATVRGRFGVDPLLVAAPVLGLLAGVVLALRIVPLLARVAERLVASRAPAVPALASWQVARRPGRYARSALLLMMAVALGVFASSFSASWLASQSDQAAHSVGADVRFIASTADEAHTDLHMRAALGGLPGVVESMPLVSIRGAVAPGRQARIAIVDASAAPAVVSLRDDLRGDMDALLQQLVERRVRLPSIPLPGEPERLVMEWRATQTDDDENSCSPAFGYCFEAAISVVLEDGTGQLHRIDAGTVRGAGVTTTLEVDFTASDSTRVVYPLSLVAFESASPLRFLRVLFGRTEDGPPPLDYELELTSLRTGSATGQADEVVLDSNQWDVDVSLIEVGSLGDRPTAALAPAAPGLRMGGSTGTGFGTFLVHLTPDGPDRARVFPILTTGEIIEDGVWSIGSRVSLQPLGLPLSTAEVIGTIDSFPGLDPNPPLVVVIDFPTYQALRYAPGQPIARPEQYWLATSDEVTDLAGMLAAPPFRARGIMETREVVASLTADPVALGTVGAFAIGFVAAAVFAGIGFAISAVVSARERLVEFALLQALGLSTRQLRAWILLEQAALIFLALGMGTLVGWGLSRLVLPLVTLTQDGSPPQPELLTIHPWGTIAVFEVALLVVLLVVVALLTTFVRRTGPQSALRFGEDS
jgi:ABC-type antimicrobial peptide transport system permease subunit